MTIEHVAIIGGGFSGTLQAINLLRHEGPRATLIERHSRIGRGVAFSAAHPFHLLNVPAGNMSAYPDDPGHFVRWLDGRDGLGAASFVPRRVYGDYLSEQLTNARAASGDRLTVISDNANNLKLNGAGITLGLEGGGTLSCDAAVLALGNLPPHVPVGLDPVELGTTRYVSDPWDGDILDGLGADDTILLLGTGLTMVDAALLLDAAGYKGKILAISRRGLLPRRHVPGTPPPSRITERPATTASALVQTVRGRARDMGWRAAVDQLRPVTQALWLAANTEERARFLRHLRPWWDVHRHRLAPDVADRVDALIASGRLTIAGGKPSHYAPSGDGLTVHWRPRGSDETRLTEVRKIVNCTGPQGDLMASGEPLLQSLVGQGLARADSCRLGLDVDPQARLVRPDGGVNDNIYALGPMTRGAFWEINAVPDIRWQTWTVARRLSNAHWIEGEGL